MKKETEMRDMEQMDARYELYDFRPESPDYVRMISSQAGIMPDYSEERLRLLRSSGAASGEYGAASGDDGAASETTGTASEVTGGEARKVLRVGIFADDMPQNIVTRVVNYRLDIVQLHGDESPVMMENLRRTIDPDIHPGIKLMKTIYVGCADDLKCCADYAGVVDYFLFEPKKPADADTKSLIDWDVLAAYDGQVPFILGGDIGPDDVERLRHFSHPAFCGISVDAQFETAYAMKDVVALKAFVECLRKGE